MNNEQEYLKFWSSVMNKIKEIEKDYDNLSDDNKRRVDGVKEIILHTHTYSDVLQVLYTQMK